MKFPKEKDKPKRQRKKSISQLKKEADRVFSIYIRQKYANKKGKVRCYTCDKLYHWKEIQCGHFVSRGYLATRYDEENCKPQDIGCNIFGGGKLAIFATKLEQEYGSGTVTRLYKKAQEIVKIDYQEIINKYGGSNTSR